MGNIINITTSDKKYKLKIGYKIIKDLPQSPSLQNADKIFIITDSKVSSLYLEYLLVNLKAYEQKIYIIEAPRGEKAKNFQVLQDLIEQIIQTNPSKNSLIIAFGGGAIGDLSSFAASLILRGIHLIQLPTTLLSMVDSSIGGKNAINSKYGKNLVGNFYHPDLVIADLFFLESLSKSEYLAGYAEILKASLISDNDFFNYLIENPDLIRRRDKKFLSRIITKSAKIKAEIVKKDEKDKNIRKILNFGHSFAHAIEKESNYKILHGEAVAIGMLMAIKLSIKLNLCKENIFNLVYDHLNKLDFKTKLTDFKFVINRENVLNNMYFDKKKIDGKIILILLKSPGNPCEYAGISNESILNLLEEF